MLIKKKNINDYLQIIRHSHKPKSPRSEESAVIALLKKIKRPAIIIISGFFYFRDLAIFCWRLSLVVVELIYRKGQLRYILTHK